MGEIETLIDQLVGVANETTEYGESVVEKYRDFMALSQSSTYRFGDLETIQKLIKLGIALVEYSQIAANQFWWCITVC